MSELTNLSESPYFDDYSPEDEYYKILFKPSLPLQTRELNQIQSIHQNQIENLSSVNYKDGEIVNGIDIGINKNLDAVLLQPIINGTLTDNILNSLIGKELIGTVTNITAVVIDAIRSTESPLGFPTIYVNYLSSGVSVNNVFYEKFTINEQLKNASDNVLAICITTPPSLYTGSQVQITSGILYYKGYFLNVSKQKLFLDYYENVPTYKIGLIINEKICTTTDDTNLYDNSYGFNNSNAIGADRLKISVKLKKLKITDKIPYNFVEIVRVVNGVVEYKIDNTISHQITDAIAKRTYELFGNFTSENFEITAKETLNNLENDGVYNINEIDSLNNKIFNTTPALNETDTINGYDYINIQLSKGIAFIKGYEYIFNTSNSLNIPKCRTYENQFNQLLTVDCGQYFNIQQITGSLNLTNSYNTIDLYDKLYDDSSKTKIGTAIATSISNANALNVDTDTRLYFVDLTTYTKLTTTSTTLNLLVGDYVTGKDSLASGYVVNYTNNVITIEHQTGVFKIDEILINSRNLILTNIVDVFDYNSENIKSLAFQNTWKSNVVLDDFILTGTSFLITNNNTISSTNSKFLEELKIGSVVKLENNSVYVTNIISNNVFTISGNVSNQSIFSLYKQIASVKYFNKTLYVESSEKNIKTTSNRKFSISKQYSVQFTNGEATVPYQIGTEIPNGIVLVQTNSTSYSAKFISTTVIKIIDNILYTGNSIITVELFKTEPNNSSKSYIKNKILRINKTKQNTSHDKYGTRFEDNELSLGVCDVDKINFIRYSRLPKDSINYVTSCFDNILVNSSVNNTVGDLLTDGNTIAEILLISANLIFVKYLTKTQFSNNSIIQNWTKNFDVNVITATSGNYVDVTDNYQLIKNIDDSIYGISKLTIINPNSLPEQELIISYNYFNSDNKDFYTVNSYVNTEYSEITKNNIIDFRITSKLNNITGNGTIINPYILTNSGLNPSDRILNYKSIPANNSEFIYDYEYYLGRIDLAVLNETGVFTTITGIPSINPEEPTPKNQLVLAKIYLPPYTNKIENVKIFSNQTKKYSMSDIGNIDNKLNELENLLKLTVLDTKTNNVNIIDINGLNKIKTGFATDEFTNYTLSDTKNILYNCGIDTEKNILLPNKTNTNITLIPKYQNSVNYKKTGQILSIDYTEIECVEQNNSTHSEEINLFGEINWQGVLKCTPNSNNWMSEISDKASIDISTPDINVWKSIYSNSTKNKIYRSNSALSNYNYFVQQQTIKLSASALKPNTELKLLINNINMNAYVLPNLCEIIKGGANNTNSISFIVGEQLICHNPNKNTLIGSKYQPQIKSDRICGTVKSLSSYETDNNPLRLNQLLPQTYEGSTEFIHVDWIADINEFDIEDYQVGSKLIGLTSGAIGELYDNRIITNSLGNWDGILALPTPKTNTNIRFDNKNLYIKLSDTLEKTTYANTNFSAYGNVREYSQNIISLKSTLQDDTSTNINQVSSNNINNIQNWHNPLSQTFLISETGGCSLTSLELFFSDKDNNLPIIVQIRTVENNIPTEVIIPFSETIIFAKNVNISSDSSVSTKIIFDGLVYLKENTKYAICVLTNSKKYKLFFAKTGKLDILTNTKIEENTYAGILYKSQNTTTWNSSKFEYLKFILNKAKFNIKNSSKIILHNNNVKNSVIVKNILSLTKNSNIINVTLNNHAYHNTQNTVNIQNVISENVPTILNTVLNNTQIINNAINISVENPETFHTIINNQPIGTNNYGYIKINKEIIAYTSVNINNNTLTIPIGGRGQNNTAIDTHEVSSIIEPYVLYGIPLLEINKTFNTITPIDLNNFEVITNSVSTKTIKTGGSNITITKNIQYESIINNCNIIEYPETKINGTINTLSNNSIKNTTETTYITYNDKFDNNNIKYYNNPMLVASPENELINNNNKKSIIYELDLTSNNPNVSPVIDLDNVGIIAITNNIDNSEIGEFVYITKHVKLLSISTGITTILDAYRLTNHTIAVYVKLYRTDNTTEFDKQNFIELTNLKYPISSKPDQFNEFLFEARNLPPFTEFQIKIVGKSNTQTSYPKIKNLRSISTI